MALNRLNNNPLLAMFAGVDGHEAVTIPSGAVLDITSKKFNADRPMEVIRPETIDVQRGLEKHYRSRLIGERSLCSTNETDTRSSVRDGLRNYCP